MSVKAFLATKIGQTTGVIVILLAFGLFGWWLMQRQDAGLMVAEGPKPAITTAGDEAARETILTMPAKPASDPAPEPESEAKAAPDAAPTADVATAQPPAAPVEETAREAGVSPTFDLVRVDELGDTVLAGRAEPGAEVQILVDGEVVAETVATSKGEFVATATLKVTPETQQMQIRAKSPDFEMVSVDPVLIIGRPVAEAPAVATEGLTDAGRAGSAALATAPSINPPAIRTAPDAAPEAILGASPKAAARVPLVADRAEVSAAPIIARTGPSGVSLLQPAQLPASDTVTLDAISYSKVGAVKLSGRGHPGWTARIYANDLAIAEVVIGADGSWNTELSEIMEPGRYVLRVDEIDAAGKVASRIESPFQREYVTDVQALDSKYIVQPGNSLWRIARVSYGRGVEYSVIYDANRDRIKNPDLIYPGQIFDLPNRQ